jgi:hypothetical protein
MVRCKEPKHDFTATVSVVHGQQAGVHFFEQPKRRLDLRRDLDQEASLSDGGRMEVKQGKSTTKSRNRDRSAEYFQR